MSPKGKGFMYYGAWANQRLAPVLLQPGLQMVVHVTQLCE